MLNLLQFPPRRSKHPPGPDIKSVRLGWVGCFVAALAFLASSARAAATVSTPPPVLTGTPGGWLLSIPLSQSTQAAVTPTEKWSPPRLVFFLPGSRASAYGGVIGKPVSQIKVTQEEAGVSVTLVMPTLFNHYAVVEGGTLKVFIQKPVLMGKTIVVDPGHGGHDPGALALSGGDDEKSLVLNAALTLKTQLEAAGARVILTRGTDLFLELKERAALANTAAPHAFVSVHANSMPWKPEVQGTETYYFSEKSKPLAMAIQEQVIAATPQVDRGFRQARFFVIRNTTMPGVLLETGFVTNSGDLARLKNPQYLHNLAAGVVNGLETFFGGKPFLRYQNGPAPKAPAMPIVIARPTPQPVNPQEARLAINFADQALGRVLPPDTGIF